MRHCCGDEANRILAAFGIGEPVIAERRLDGGRIHGTYRIETVRGAYIAQRMHLTAFAEPSLVMANIEAVTAHIRAQFPDRTTLHFHQTADGGYLWNGWRLMDCIPGVMLSPSDGEEVIRSAGFAWGQFLVMLNDMETSRLYETLPGFHDTPRCFQALDAAVNDDPLGRAAPAGELLVRFDALREEACALCRAQLPVRVIHGDTKCSNILFDPVTRQPAAVIDLDTVMPGLAAYDFGDAVRSLWEERVDTLKLRAFSEGYLSGAECLTSAERQSLVPGIFSVTAELAARYLTDFLTGDAYFRHPDSLHRAGTLISLAEEICVRRSELASIMAADQ